MRGTIKFIWWIIKLTVKAMLLVSEAMFWLLAGLRWVTLVGIDLVRARRSMKGGVLYCPDGHEIPTDNIICECTACGFTYKGSLLKCPNPECTAPVTPFIDCPECGLSVRNPYRWGRL